MAFGEKSVKNKRVFLKLAFPRVSVKQLGKPKKESPRPTYEYKCKDHGHIFEGEQKEIDIAPETLYSEATKEPLPPWVENRLSKGVLE